MKNYLYYTREQAEKAVREYCDEHKGYIRPWLSEIDTNHAEPCDDFLEKIGSSWQGTTAAIEFWGDDDNDSAKFGWWED